MSESESVPSAERRVNLIAEHDWGMVSPALPRSVLTRSKLIGPSRAVAPGHVGVGVSTERGSARVNLIADHDWGVISPAVPRSVLTQSKLIGSSRAVAPSHVGVGVSTERGSAGQSHCGA